MTHTHSSEKHPKGHIPKDVFRSLIDRTEEYVVQADKLGIKLGVAYQNGYTYSQAPNELEPVELGYRDETFAASHAKLAVAAYTIERLTNPDEQLPLMKAMLRISDDDAFRKLVGENAPDIVADARVSAGISTDILKIREDGSYYGGKTTATDSMRLLVHLLQTAKQNGLRDDVSRSLAHNTSRYGVRTSLSKAGPKVIVMNKTGDMYGEDDPEVGEDVHHDVGVIFTRKDRERHKRRFVYSLTTSAPTRARARVANKMVRQLGAEYVTAVGGTPKRLVGSRAIVWAANPLLS